MSRNITAPASPTQLFQPKHRCKDCDLEREHNNLSTQPPQAAVGTHPPRSANPQRTTPFSCLRRCHGTGNDDATLSSTLFQPCLIISRLYNARMLMCHSPTSSVVSSDRERHPTQSSDVYQMPPYPVCDTALSGLCKHQVNNTAPGTRMPRAQF